MALPARDGEGGKVSGGEVEFVGGLCLTDDWREKGRDGDQRHPVGREKEGKEKRE